LKQKRQRWKEKWKWGEKSEAGWEKRKRDRVTRAVCLLLLFFKKDTEHEQKVLSATSYCRDIERKELHCCWTQWVLRQHRLASETQERRAVRLEKMSSQKKNLLSSEITVLERAARWKQVSAQKNNVLICHTVQMHTLVQRNWDDHKLWCTQEERPCHARIKHQYKFIKSPQTIIWLMSLSYWNSAIPIHSPHCGKSLSNKLP